jgi:hypothetical protein
MPLNLPSNTSNTKPASPQIGELFYDTALKALVVYNGSDWTSNIFPLGSTANRPSNVPVHYLYFDTDIGKLLRYASLGWTTIDGQVGDVKIVDFPDASTALTQNPGWSEFTSFQGKFVMGYNSDITPQTENGNLADCKLTWSANLTKAQGGARDQAVISSLTVNGTSADSTAATNTVDLTPPYKAVIFLRKDY